MPPTAGRFIAATLALLVATVAPFPAGATEDQVRVIVPLDPVDQADLQAALEDTGGDLIRVDQALGFAVATTPDPTELATRLEVPIEPDGRAIAAAQAAWLDVPADPLYPDQWAPIHMEMPKAWGVQDGDPGVIVAVVDSGIALDHEDLPMDRVLLGHDYVEGDEVPQDEVGHGTFVAGIVAAARDNGLGIAGMAEVTVLAIRVLDAKGQGTCSDVASGVREAVDAGATVVNLSLLCAVDSQMLHDAVRYAEDQGVLVVAAAGNHWDDDPSRCVAFPARYPEAVAVAALRQAPGVRGVTLDVTASGFSCRGDEVELAAPGQRVLSTTLGGYTWGTGTSVATPHAAATAGLILSHIPELTGDGLRQRLANTATDLGPDGRDNTYGHGAIDPLAALGGIDPIPGPG